MVRQWTVAVVAGKGGVGKTTTAINLGAVLAEAGMRCLLVDCDPQANLTSGVGLDPYRLELSMGDVLAGRCGVADAVRATALEGLDVLPASPDLTSVEREMASSIGRELALRRALHDGGAGYDLVVFDTPPSFGFHTVSAMAAARHVLVPLQVSGFALRGLKEVLRTVAAARRQLNPELSVLGVAPTFTTHTRFSREILEAISDTGSLHVFSTTISQSVRLQESGLIGAPITVHAPGSRAADEYRLLGGEVAGRLRAIAPAGDRVEEFAAIALAAGAAPVPATPPAAVPVEVPAVAAQGSEASPAAPAPEAAPAPPARELVGSRPAGRSWSPLRLGGFLLRR